MAKFTFTKDEVPKFELLKPGLYAFEVVGFESGLGAKKTANNAVLTLKCRFFALLQTDKNAWALIDWAKPIAQWNERLTIPLALEQCFDKSTMDQNVFFGGVCNMFVMSTGMTAEAGQEIELDEDSVIGLRGVAYVTQFKLTQGARAGEMCNHVKTWCTDGPKFQRNTPVKSEEEPF